MNSAGTSLLRAEKARGTSLLFLASVVRTNDAPKSRKVLPCPFSPSPDGGWRTAKSGSERVVNPMIRS